MNKIDIFYKILLFQSVQGTTCCSGTFWNEETFACEGRINLKNFDFECIYIETANTFLIFIYYYIPGLCVFSPIVTDCPLGYHDFNCSEICIFPSYGEDCQNTCECNSSVCDYRYGCREPIGYRIFLFSKPVLLIYFFLLNCYNG